MAWFKTWFNTPYYHILYKNRDFNEARQFISLLVEDLRLPQNSKIIDLACGKGRHSLFLNHLKYNVLGLDLSEENIEHNKNFENETLKFAVHDMRDEIDAEKVDAVFNLFTSFGFFDDSADDEKVFCSVSNILKQGGYFVIDFLNQEFVKSTLEPQTIVEREHLTFNISRKIENQFVIKDIRFRDGEEEFHFFERVKLHTLEEIELLAEKFGLERMKTYGDYQLMDFQLLTSPRCISIFKKN